MPRVTIAFDLPEQADERLAARRIGALARGAGLAVATRTKRRGAPSSVAKDEAPDHVRRITAALKGMARRAECDLDHLASLYALRAVLDDALAEAATNANRHHSWSQIAEACGMQKQSAYERWANRRTPAAP